MVKSKKKKARGAKLQAKKQPGAEHPRKPKKLNRDQLEQLRRKLLEKFHS